MKFQMYNSMVPVVDYDREKLYDFEGGNYHFFCKLVGVNLYERDGYIVGDPIYQSAISFLLHNDGLLGIVVRNTMVVFMRRRPWVTIQRGGNVVNTEDNE